MTPNQMGMLGVCVAIAGAVAACGNTNGDAESTAARASAVNATSAANHPGPFSAVGSDGLIAGTKTWVVPGTPNGLVTDQAWFSVAGAPDGNVYVGACDHTTNSALYRVTPSNDLLSYLGDARSASEAVDNWLPGETAEKFHVRPLWYQDRVYVATADYSNQDDLYLQRRGFHWYGYDTNAASFDDLSASEPNGVGAEHISIFSTVLDASRGVIYGLGSPTSHLYRYDIASRTTTDLGRSPLLARPYYNPGRYIWLDSGGRVHMTVATAGTLAPGEPATPLYVLTWDPVVGWGAEPSFVINEMLRTGQCTADHARCYIMDYKLRLYRFDTVARTFTKLTTGILDDAHFSQRVRGIRVRTMHLSANEKKIYFINDSANATSLYEWDYQATDYPLELARTETIDPDLQPTLLTGYRGYTGHDGWDLQGRFYMTAFGGEEAASPNVKVVRVDPVVTKAALGILPGVPTVAIRGAGPGLHLVRHGDSSRDLSVLLQVAGESGYRTVTAPAGQTSVPVAIANQSQHTVSVVPDGDTYLSED